MPYMESFKHCEELFVMHVVVKLSGLEYMRVECNQMNLLFLYYDQKNSCKSVL